MVLYKANKWKGKRPWKSYTCILYLCTHTHTQSHIWQDKIYNRMGGDKTKKILECKIKTIEGDERGRT